MSWWPSFTFSLPTFSLPPSIQRRFFSFILKRSLGHLLKPGQLDVAQIDAQIGNGFVEVKDLELDSAAVGALLKDLPFELQSGSICRVTVRIPWPNPFTSMIGLSVSGLHLTLLLLPPRISSESMSEGSAHDLAESVASVAETFMHDELSQGEEALLRESIYAAPPGSLDPFLVDDEQHRSTGTANDPEGISIFAGLFERLLARFEFDASDIRVKVIHPGNASFSLHVGQIQYFAGSANDNGEPASLAEKRTVEISGLKITMQDMKPRTVTNSTISARPSTMHASSAISHSPVETSDSDIDEDTQMMMSQSLAALPPRDAPPLSPALSTISSASETSSMYESAVSASVITGDASKHFDSLQDHKLPEDTIFAITDAITVSLTTPPPYTPQQSNEPIYEVKREEPDMPIRLDIVLDLVVVAIRAHNVQAILRAVETLIPLAQTTPSKPGAPRASASIIDRLVCSLRLKGLVGLALSNDDELIRNDERKVDSFFQHPLVPPILKRGYLRLHIDTVKAQLSVNGTRPSHSPLTDVHNLSPVPSFSCTVSDFSLFAFHGRHPSSSGNIMHSSPIIITDHHLSSSYHHLHANASYHTCPRSEDERSRPLPIFDIIDWTSENGGSHGASLRHWRTRPHAHGNRRFSSGQGGGASVNSNVGFSSSSRSPKVRGLGLPSSPPRLHTPPQRISPSSPPASKPQPPDSASPSISVQFTRKSSRDTLRVDFMPLHAFVELKQVGSVLRFLDDALPPEAPLDHSREELDVESSYTEERNFLEGKRQVTSSPTRAQSRKEETRLASKSPSLSFEIIIPLLRTEIRAPPAPGHQCRSGSLVLDLHGVEISTAGLPERTSGALRFQQDTQADDDWANDLAGKDLVTVQVRRLVVAYAQPDESVAKVLLSVGSLSLDDNTLGHLQNVFVAFSPAKPTDPAAQALGSPATLLVRFPSVHVALTKENLDGLQLWADDSTQWIAKLGTTPNVSTSSSAGVSRNPSLIGSRYFAKRSGSDSTESDMANVPANDKSVFIVKILSNDAFVRLSMSAVKEQERKLTRLLDVCASGIDGLVEIKPDGKDEMIATVSVSGIAINEKLVESSHTFVRTRMPEGKASQHQALKIRFHSLTVPETTAKESRVRLALFGLSLNFWCNTDWAVDLAAFAKAPPGAFETVVPSERTRLNITISESSVRLTAPTHPGALVLSLCDVGFSTVLVGDSPESAMSIVGAEMSVFLIDDCAALRKSASDAAYVISDGEYWSTLGYALLANIRDFKFDFKQDNSKTPVDIRVDVDGLNLDAHLCADTISGIASFVSGVQSSFVTEEGFTETLPVDPVIERKPTESTSSSATQSLSGSTNLLRSLDEDAFRKPPQIGPTPDFVEDDLPSNLEYLDSSFGAAAGLRPLDDEDLDDFVPEEVISESYRPMTGVSRFGGETIRMLQPTISAVENFYDTLPPGALVTEPDYGETQVRVRLNRVNCRLLLYEGYDWDKTRSAIQDEVKRVKKRLAKIRQLLANGQSYDPTVDEVNTILFNSVYVGLDQEAEELEPGALIVKIDEELQDDQTDVGSESSWQSFKTKMPAKPQPQGFVAQAKKLTRSRSPNIEFSLQTFDGEFDQYRAKKPVVSKLFFTIRDVEILDHMKTSTWSTFMTQMRSDSRGNIREAQSSMVRVELQTLLPNTAHVNEEARLKAKLLPLRLHVDQDALDFLKKFFSFSDPSSVPSAPPTSSPSQNEIYFQHAEVFPVDIKLDYKPRRVDYRALKEGKSIELMNFFHFDGAEMTLRHITLKGITGWPRFFDSLNDLWTPDVKANQLVDVISGVSPIRSVVNVGSGVADLVLLPIAQYKKDGRIIRGLQKGTKAFVKSTAMEAIKLGAELATGTQVVLEQAENFLGGQGPITAETLQGMSSAMQIVEFGGEDDDSDVDLISRYAEQPRNVKEGVKLASKAFAKNLKYAGQTILAVPMEVYEKSSTEGPARSVIRAVPIAVLKPMIGASEAVSKTLLGLRNTLDPTIPIDTEVKYKHR